MPVKLIVVVVALVCLPVAVSVEWATNAYGISWDEAAMEYLKKVVAIL